MDDVVIHPHAMAHGLTEDELRHAWRSGGPRMPRTSPNEDEVVAIGWTRDGRAVQMVGIVKDFGTLIIHGLEPPTEKVLKELGLEGGRRR